MRTGFARPLAGSLGRPPLAKAGKSERMLRSKTLSASIGHASRMMQPGVNDLPLVTPAWAEVQKRGASVLKLAEELQAIAGGRRCRVVDRLGLEPTIPFLKHLGLPLILSH